MAAIVPDDPYQCLMRKIGYSVGLEELLKRVLALTDCYVNQRRLSYTFFKELVETEYGRPGATQDFADFYKELHLLQIAWKTAYPLYTLDTLSILRRFFAGDEISFVSAAKIVLLHTILEADGDIFLNALAAEFDPVKFENLARNMIGTKWQAIAKVIQSRALLHKLRTQIINIQSQPSNRGNQRTQNKDVDSRFKPQRTESLDMSHKRTKPLADILDDQITISEDVLKKIPRTRKAWAKDFGLFERDSISKTGQDLLNTLDQDLGLKQNSGCFICWPYFSDFAKIRIEPEKIGATRFSRWDLLTTTAKGLESVKVEEFKDNHDYSDIIMILKKLYGLYQEANIERSSIRLQLPLYIAQPCLVGIFAAKKENIPPLQKILDVESRKQTRRVEIVIIRETEGGITFPK
jgi:hypothetical protein